MQQADFIWMNGEIVRWEDTKVHVLTHALHYGSGVFEGIRAYEKSGGPPCFATRTTSTACAGRRSSITWTCRTRWRRCGTPRTS